MSGWAGWKLPGRLSRGLVVTCQKHILGSSTEDATRQRRSSLALCCLAGRVSSVWTGRKAMQSRQPRFDR